MTKKELDKLTLELAYHILDNNTTIRATAKAFNIPKSTVHHILKTNLKFVSYPLHKQVRELMIRNFNTKHIHGGEATKKKYEQLKNEINEYNEYEFKVENGELKTQLNHKGYKEYKNINLI